MAPSEDPDRVLLRPNCRRHASRSCWVVSGGSSLLTVRIIERFDPASDARYPPPRNLAMVTRLGQRRLPWRVAGLLVETAAKITDAALPGMNLAATARRGVLRLGWQIRRGFPARVGILHAGVAGGVRTAAAVGNRCSSSASCWRRIHPEGAIAADGCACPTDDADRLGGTRAMNRLMNDLWSWNRFGGGNFALGLAGGLLYGVDGRGAYFIIAISSRYRSCDNMVAECNLPGLRRYRTQKHGQVLPCWK